MLLQLVYRINLCENVSLDTQSIYFQILFSPDAWQK